MAQPNKNQKPAPTAIVKEETKAVGKFNYGAMGSAGKETIRHDQLTVPYLYQMQDKSAPVKEGKNPLARPGNFYNTVTGKCYDSKQGVTVIPLRADLEYVEWIPVDAGGGFIGKFRPEAPEVAAAKKASKKFGEYYTGEPTKEYPLGAHELVETHLWWALISDDGVHFEEVIIPFVSTKIKAFKKMNSAIKGYMPEDEIPLFAHQVLLTGVYVPEKPDYWTIDMSSLNGDVANSLLNPEDEGEAKLLERAFKTYNLIGAGEMKADDESLQRMAKGQTQAQQRPAADPSVPF